MSVTLYDDPGGEFYSQHIGYFPDYGDGSSAANLDYYAMGDSGYTWNNEVSSLYSSTGIVVFEGPGYTGDSAYFTGGFIDVHELEDYGIADNSISSFYTVEPLYLA
jgi:hypothetical protein